MPTKSTAEEPICISFQSVQQVVVTDEDDGGRFVTTSREAALACRSALDKQASTKQFESFLARIHASCASHADVVARAYVATSAEGLTVVIVTKGDDYRLDFDDEITNLDIALAREHPNCPADVHQSPECPPESLIPYMSPAKAIQVYGD